MKDLPDPILITRPGALQRLVVTLQKEPILAVDTESNSLYAYREQVCLVQFSTPKVDYLLDPLALKDLSPLADVFSNPAIEKVFHAAEYDLICLKRDFGFEFDNLFDTMLAARILGREAFGLGALLEAEFDVHLDKHYQRANWGQRPLPADLLAYARLDTHYLIRLRHRLKAELQARNLMPLALEDFNRMAHVNGRSAEDRPADCWRISGAYDLSPRQAAVLAALCQYRDQVAHTLNRPLFKVISDKALLAIAEQSPRSLAALAAVPGISARQVERFGAQLAEAVQRGLRAQPLYPPRNPRPSDEYLARLEALRRWRKAVAEQMGVNSDVVLPRELLHDLAQHKNIQPDELAALMEANPWRLAHFGEQILKVLREP
jgi:ribonuclease D